MKSNMTKKRVRGGTIPHADLFDRAPMQRKFFNTLYKCGLKGTDVSIVRLYRMGWEGELEFRMQQQYVGAIISMINKKIVPLGMKIKTGKTRRSYRLYRL